MPMSPESLKFEKVIIGGQPFLRVDGNAMNYLGQFQLINVDRDDSNHQVIIMCLVIPINPFSKVRVADGWPVFCPLAGAKSGKYSIVYKSNKAEAVIGSVDVP